MSRDVRESNMQPDGVILNEREHSQNNQSSGSMGTVTDRNHVETARTEEASSPDQRDDDKLREKAYSDVGTTTDDNVYGEEDGVKADCDLNCKASAQATANIDDQEAVVDSLGTAGGDGDKEDDKIEKSSADNRNACSVDTRTVQDAGVSPLSSTSSRTTTSIAALSKYAAAGYALEDLEEEDSITHTSSSLPSTFTRPRGYLSRMPKGTATARPTSASSATCSSRLPTRPPRCTNVSNALLDGYASSGELSRDARVAAKIVQERMTLDARTSTSNTVPSTKKDVQETTKDPPQGGDLPKSHNDEDEEKEEEVTPITTTKRRSQSERGVVGHQQQQPRLHSHSLPARICRGVSDPGAVFVAGMDATSGTFRDYDASALSLPRPSKSGSNLIEATLVQSLDFVEAQPLDPMLMMDYSHRSVATSAAESAAIAILEQQREKDRTLGAKVLIGICFLLVVGAIVVAAVVTRGNNHTNSSAEEEKPSLLYPPFTLELSALTVERITQNASSPQARANRWILQDPNLQNYSTPRLLLRFGLATLYYATGGGESKWFRDDHWLSYEVHECHWYSSHPPPAGPVCRERFGEQLALDTLNVSHNGLIGKLPLEILYVDAHSTVDLSHNQLRGRGPPVGRGARMKQIVASHNGFEGELVARGWANPKLRVLRLDGNRFNGTIPAAFFSGGLPSLEELDLSSNRFGGSLPPSGPTSSLLRIANLADNQLTGTLPVGLAESWPNLQQLNLSGNSGITGTIPSEIGILGNLSLLDVRGTSLMGVVPEELCQLVVGDQLEILVDCDRVSCCLDR